MAAMTATDALNVLSAMGTFGLAEHVQAVDTLTNLVELAAELRALIERHEAAAVAQYGPGTPGYAVAVAELRNILEPGSAPMYPAEPGFTATCSTCAPNGDGRSTRRGG